MTLKCSTSLWSADLTNLASEIERVEPFSERFHLDVADGRLIDTFLFFPDLIRAMRPRTELPFEVHLITERPRKWVDTFIDAGADILIFYLNAGGDEAETIAHIRARGKRVGVSVRVADDLDILEPYWSDIDIVTVMGTDSGKKGVDMDPSVPDRIRQCRTAVRERGLQVEIEADGGIRKHTVPLVKEAGADYIVPGSLMFGEDPQETRRWLDSL